MSFLSLNESESEAFAAIGDEELLAASLSKPAAFELLLERYQEAFLRKAQQVIGSREDAEDIVQEVFTKIYRNAGNFQKQEGASFKSWGYKILMNTSFSHYQKRKRHGQQTVPLTEELEAILPDRKSRDFEHLEIADYVTSVFSRMSDPFQHVLERYFIAGKSQAEIADEEGVSVGAIKTRVHRAKEEFKKVSVGVTTV